MTANQRWDVMTILRLTEEFESRAHVCVTTSITTDGGVSLLVRDDSAAAKHTYKFKMPLQAVEWLREALE